MTRTIALALLIVINTVSCQSNRQPSQDHDRITAADAFTNRYARSRLSRWNVRGRAAGTDCGVLFIETSIVMEDSMVEALHYGAGAYDVYRGGVRQFSRDRAFRGVAYKDRTGRVWTFGDISSAEADTVVPCG